MYRIKDVSAIFKSTDNEGDVMLFFERSEDLHVSSKKRATGPNEYVFDCPCRLPTIMIFMVINMGIQKQQRP